MANDLALRRVDLQALISSRECVALRRISLGTLIHPGERPVKYLSGGLTLTAEQRGAIERKVAELRVAAIVVPNSESRKIHLGLIASMLLAYPVTGTAEAGKARSEAYLYAIEDIPAWLVNDVIKAWHRGECGSDYNYRWAPAPAELRTICLSHLRDARGTIDHLEAVLDAPTLEQAMNPPPAALPKLRAV